MLDFSQTWYFVVLLLLCPKCFIRNSLLRNSNVVWFAQVIAQSLEFSESSVKQRFVLLLHSSLVSQLLVGGVIMLANSVVQIVIFIH